MNNASDACGPLCDRCGFYVDTPNHEFGCAPKFKPGGHVPGPLQSGEVKASTSDWRNKISSALGVQPGEFNLALDEAVERIGSYVRGAETLGSIVDRQVTDLLRWAGMEDQIGLQDPDQQTAWERVAEMPHKIKAAERRADAADVRVREVLDRERRERRRADAEESHLKQRIAELKAENERLRGRA